MINLFKDYTERSIDLVNSLTAAGYKHQTVVLNDDGYLPSNILTPINFFTDTWSDTEGIPKFFNEIPVPKHWEIKGTNLNAEIFDGYRRKGKINYSAREEDFRFVKSVEWFNDEGRLRCIDLYNQQGQLFGRETYSDGELTLTTYFDSKQSEVILINHITHTIQVAYQEKIYLFDNYNDFILFFFDMAQLDVTEIFYNNLGTPFFITSTLQEKNPKIQYKHTLFWQEESTTIPSNMSYLLSGISGTQHIIIQNKEEYIRVKQQISNMKTDVSVDYLGTIYNLKKRTKINQSILILTASDNIAQLQEFVESLPRCNFYIAARTTMSSRLLAFEKFTNVHLYPVVDDATLYSLLSMCSIYLDINHGYEVENIVRHAFEYSQLIMGFKETMHNHYFTDNNHVFKFEQLPVFIEKIKQVTKNSKLYRQAIDQQLSSANQATRKEYKELLG